MLLVLNLLVLIIVHIRWELVDICSRVAYSWFILRNSNLGLCFKKYYTHCYCQWNWYMLKNMGLTSTFIQVVRRNAACHEVSQQIIQPQVARTSLLSPMLQKVASPKGGLSSAFRGGPSRVFQSSLSAKPGVRSLQWKRDSSAAQPADGVKKLQKVSPSQRSFTYVRSTSKPESNSGNLSWSGRTEKFNQHLENHRWSGLVEGKLVANEIFFFFLLAMFCRELWQEVFGSQPLLKVLL